MRRVSALIVSLVLVGVLAGCVRVELNLRVKPDGTGEREVIVAADRDVLLLAAAVDGQDPLAQVEADMRSDPAAVVTRYQQGDLVGLRSVAPMERRLVFTDESVNGEFRIDDRFFWRDYTLDLKTYVDAGDLGDLAAPYAPYLSVIDAVVSVELPTEVRETNGQLDASGRKVVWHLMPERQEHLTLKARQYLWDRIAITCASAGATVLAAAAGLIVAARRKQPPKPPEEPAEQSGS